jgi:hypothetical protein
MGDELSCCWILLGMVYGSPDETPVKPVTGARTLTVASRRLGNIPPGLSPVAASRYQKMLASRKPRWAPAVGTPAGSTAKLRTSGILTQQALDRAVGRRESIGRTKHSAGLPNDRR